LNSNIKQTFKMNKSKHIFLIICLSGILLQGSPIFAQDDIPEGITLAFKAANAVELAKHFHSNIELVILEKEDVYSKAQAEQIIRKFFKDNQPTSFQIIFEGGKENSRYAIGKLVTANGNFRVYFLIKKQEGNPLIHQLRIEEEDGENI